MISYSMLRDIDLYRNDPYPFQDAIFKHLLWKGSDTLFGHEHNFSQIKNLRDFRRNVPIRDYNALSPYIEKAHKGEDYVLYGERTNYFAKSSGTSGAKSKFIPVTGDNLHGCHFKGFMEMLATYINDHPDTQILDGKALTLGGTITGEKYGLRTIWSGDLSGILLKNSPDMVELSRMPERSVSLISDFHEKIAKVCETCSGADITNFSGVPSWNLMMLKAILDYTGKRNISEVWPNLELFMHGGTSFEAYRKQFHEFIPSGRMRYLENYNASEGYFAFQDDLHDPSMLLTADNGVFYEFATLQDERGHRDVCTLDEVSAGVPYSMIISTSAGLWRYEIGDVVKFTSVKPYKIVLMGRTALCINVFGEELMIANAEKALASACAKTGAEVSDFTVAPVFMSEGMAHGAHEWAVEFVREPSDLEAFADILDAELCEDNSDYEAKRTHTYTMDRLIINSVPKGTFFKWMESRGKLGGQNKVPRLSEKRDYLESVLKLAKA
jgi:GH3 auxin-responsive promoter.